MPVPDDEPQYWLRDSSGNLVGSFYLDGNGDPAIVDENGNEASLESDGTWDVPAVSTDDAVISNWRQTATFTLFDEAGTVKAMDPHGDVKHTGTDPGVVLNACIQDLPNYPGQTSASGPDVAGGWRIHTTDYFTGVATKVVFPGSGAFDSNYATIEITGQGLGTGFQMADGADLDALFEWERPESGEQAHGHALRNMLLEGNQGNNSSGTACKAVLPSGHSGTLGDCYFTDLFILNFAGHGLDTSGISDNKYISNLLTEGNGGHGINDGAGHTFASNVSAGNNGGHGMKLVGQLSNSWVWGNQQHGIVAFPDTQVSGTTCSANNASSGGYASVTANDNCSISVVVNPLGQPGGTPDHFVEFFGTGASVEVDAKIAPGVANSTGRAAGDGNTYNNVGLSSGAPTAADWDDGERVWDQTNSLLYEKVEGSMVQLG